MPTVSVVHAVHEGEMRIKAQTRGHRVSMDYPLKSSETIGMTPLELLLASLAGCSGNALALLLKRLSHPVDGIEVEARGVRREEHPTVFTEIHLEFRLKSKNIDRDVVTCALAECETRICPVWAMLKAGTPITSSFVIE